MMCKILSNTILFVINVEEIFDCTSLSIVKYLLMNQAHMFFLFVNMFLLLPGAISLFPSPNNHSGFFSISPFLGKIV